MTSFLGLLAALSVALVVLAGVALWWRSLPALGEVLRRPTTRIGELSPGEREVAGRIHVERPVQGWGGGPCALVAIEVHSEWTSGSGKQRTTHHERRTKLLCGEGVTVQDASGSCRLLLRGVVVSADPVRWSLAGHEIEAHRGRHPEHLALMVEGAEIVVIERRIRRGQRVLVSGVAREDEQADADDYRRASGRACTLGANAERKLLVAAGTQGQVVLRVAGPLLAAALLVGGVLWMAWQAAAIGAHF